MTSADSSSVDQKFLANAMASFLQILAVFTLLYWCFLIVSPFVSIVVWAIIISVAVYPAHVALTAKVGGRKKTSATIIVLIGLAIIIVPRDLVLGVVAVLWLALTQTTLFYGATFLGIESEGAGIAAVLVSLRPGSSRSGL